MLFSEFNTFNNCILYNDQYNFENIGFNTFNKKSVKK